MQHLENLKRAMNLQIEGKLKEAEVIYQEILAESPEDPDATHLLGLIRSEQDNNEEAISLIEKAISLRPEAAPFHHNIAGIYRRTGRLDDAEIQFREAIRLKPDYGEAYQGLAEMVKFKAGDPLQDQVQQQLARPEMDRRVRCYFNFAAGKIHDDLGDYTRAFQHYTEGNREADKPWDVGEFRQRVKDTLYSFSKDYADSVKQDGYQSDQPVFIVGMPRSGTTLVEQILASHSGVYGAGELNDMKLAVRLTEQAVRGRAPFPNNMPLLRGKVLSQIGETYVKRTQALADKPDYAHIIDKHPLNFQFVGLILSILPQARIIHTVRHPLDTCVSCFFQNFTKGQHYSFDIEKLGHFYNDYRRLMDYWQLLYPDQITTIAYENVLADQESETRRLLDFLELEFEPQCLEFHRTERVVKTASFMQVRQPLYKSSKNRWEHYSGQLQKLAQIIGYPIEQPVTISAANSLLR